MNTTLTVKSDWRYARARLEKPKKHWWDKTEFEYVEVKILGKRAEAGIDAIRYFYLCEVANKGIIEIPVRNIYV